MRGSDAIECYHDRVREAVVASIPANEKKEHHQRLASSLSAANSGDAEALTLHFREAGDSEQAAWHAIRAADQASRALAFDRAARLYQLAIELRPGRTDENRRLCENLGHVLVADGRGKEAAQAYLAAAATDTDVAALDLKRRAAEQLLASGYLDDGLATIESVLGALGMKTPRNTEGAVRSFLFQQARLAVRGRKPTPTSKPPSTEELLKIDTCVSAGLGLLLVQVIHGVDFMARGLRLALDSGDLFRSARALAADAAILSAFVRKKSLRVMKRLTAARSTAEASGEALAVGTTALADAIAIVNTGAWKEALERLQQAESILRERCTGAHWEINAGRLYQLVALYSLGRIREMAALGMVCVRESEQRGNVFTAAIGRTNLNNVAWLCDDDPAEAARQLEIAMGLWSQSGFHQQHVWDLTARGNIDLYVGTNARDYLEPRWGLLERSQLLRAQMNRQFLWELRGRAALGAAAVTKDASVRKSLLADARRAVRRLAGDGGPWAHAFGVLLEAQLAHLDGRAEDASALLARATAEFDAAGMDMHAAVARSRRGTLLGGDEGAQLVAEGTSWMARERIARPDRWLAMLSPGFA
jgi:hypothetical protein